MTTVRVCSVVSRMLLLSNSFMFSSVFDCFKMFLGTFDMSLDHLCVILAVAGPCTANFKLNP